MNKIPQNYKYHCTNEEKKEDNFNVNNNLYSDIQIEGIIKDLKNKGYNDFQIKDIISSIIKNNNNQNNKSSNSNINSQEQKVQTIKRGQVLKILSYNSSKNETEYKQRNEYNKYNTKIYISNNLSERRFKNYNDRLNKRKISEKINITSCKTLFTNNNQQIITIEKNNNKKIDNFFEDGDIIKRKKINSPNSPNNDSKVKFNNYSFYDSKNNKLSSKEIKINNVINNHKGKKVLKYTNRKQKNDDKKNNKKNNNNQIIKNIGINETSKKSILKKKPKTIEKNEEIQNIKNKDDSEYEKKVINKQRSVRQFKQYLSYKNIKLSYNLNNNKNNEINKENIKKVVICNNKPANSKINDKMNYSNYIYHDISKDIINNSMNNTKKYFLKHYDSNACLKKINKNSIEFHIPKIKNENYLKSKNKPIREIRKIIFDKNIKLVKKKISYNNISKKEICDTKKRPKLSENNISIKNILNVPHNAISIAIEPSYQKKVDSLKNLRYNDLENNKKIRNYSENKQITKYKIENQNVLNYISRRKKFKDGQYEGIIINGKRELRGIMNYKDGSKYEGQWKDDKRHGKGVFTSMNYNNPNLAGIKYEGEFNNDRIEGFGIAKYTSGDKYEGEWKNNKQYGKGALNYVGGGKYVGEWKNGKLNGEGIYYLKNGERFEGKFEDNKYNGYGKYYYNNGEFLEGIFKDDLPSGECLLHKVDGSIEDKHFN